MGILDAPLRNVSKNLLGTFGTDVTLVEPDENTDYDPSSRTVSGGFDIEHEVSALVESFSSLTTRFSVSQDNSHVEAGDLGVVVAASDAGLGATPDADWGAEIDGVRYEVVGVDPVRSGDEIALYVLQVRR